MGGPVPGQLRNLVPVFPYHGLLLCAAPTLDLPLQPKCIVATDTLLIEHQLDRSAAKSKSTEFVRIMAGDAQFEIVGVASVITVVIASDDINPECHFLMAPVMSL